MQTTSCTWPKVVSIGEDPAAHGHAWGWVGGQCGSLVHVCMVNLGYEYKKSGHRSNLVLRLAHVFRFDISVIAKYDARVYLVWTLLGINFFLRSLYYSVSKL